MVDVSQYRTGADLDMDRLTRALDGLACAADPEFDDDESIHIGNVSSSISGLSVGDTAEVTLELTYTVTGESDDALINPIWFPPEGADGEAGARE